MAPIGDRLGVNNTAYDENTSAQGEALRINNE